MRINVGNAKEQADQWRVNASLRQIPEFLTASMLISRKRVFVF